MVAHHLVPRVWRQAVHLTTVMAGDTIVHIQRCYYLCVPMPRHWRPIYRGLTMSKTSPTKSCVINFRDLFCCPLSFY
jgi:hypothetical protein